MTRSTGKMLAFIAWSENLVRSLERLTEAERRALDEWESSSDFLSIGDWPGWMPHIGPCPTAIPDAKTLTQGRKRRLASGRLA